MCRVSRRIAALRAWTNLDSEETDHPLGSASTALPCLALPQQGGFVTTLLSAALIPASLYCTVSCSLILIGHVEDLILIGHVDCSLPAKDTSEHEGDLRVLLWHI